MYNIKIYKNILKKGKYGQILLKYRNFCSSQRWVAVRHSSLASRPGARRSPAIGLPPSVGSVHHTLRWRLGPARGQRRASVLLPSGRGCRGATPFADLLAKNTRSKICCGCYKLCDSQFLTLSDI